MSDHTSHPLPDGEVTIFEPAEGDRGRMYVLDVLGVGVLVRQRPDGEIYIHIDTNDAVSQDPVGSDFPIAVEVNNGGESHYGDE